MQSVPRATENDCGICGEAQVERIGEFDRHQAALPTVACRTCGLVRHQQIPTAEELAEFYAREYRQSYHGEATPSARRILRAWRNGERLYKLLYPYLPRSGRVVEIGAGIGCTVKVLQNAGYAARGLEPHEGFCHYGREQLRSPLVHASLDQLPPDESWDAALLVHVIEHLRDPVDALRRIRAALRPEGLLYVECPNLAGPFAVAKNLFHQAHIYNFTPTTLRGAAARAGFDVEAELSTQRCGNLAFVLRRTEHPTPLSIDTLKLGYQETQEGLRRARWLPYHLRWAYLTLRVRKLGKYLVEFATADRFVQQLLARCRRDPPVEDLSLSALRRAA